MVNVKELDSESLYTFCDPSELGFETTEELDTLKGIIGQDRVVSSIEFGVSMERDGYNIFALGPNETDKRELVQDVLRDQKKNGGKLYDWCYVNNFEEHYKPLHLKLRAGRGCKLRTAMEQFISELETTLTAAFESEEYQNRKQAIQEQVQEEQGESFNDLQRRAQQKGLALVRTPAGFSFAPMKDGDMMTQEQMQELSDEDREELEQKTEQMQEELQKLLRQMPSRKREVREKVRELDREIADYSVRDMIDEIREKFSDNEGVLNFLDNVHQDIIDNVHEIIGQQGQNQLMAMMGQGGQDDTGSPQDNPTLRRYKVNVIVDNDETEEAPIVYEDNPNFKNLLGRVEYQSRMGALTTDFNLIKPGALHRANGGYLLLDARRVLLEPFAWEGLKRTLKSGRLKIESPGESYGLISTASLDPEPIDLDVKVVLLGERMLYYLLCEYDPDFKSLFKVEADFEDEMDRSTDNQKLYARLVGALIRENELQPFSADAVARVIEQSARLVEDSEKLSTRNREIVDLLRESDFWAAKSGHDTVQREDVQQAIDQKDYRSSRLRDKVQESIQRDMLFIDTEGEATGQINGLSVLSIGNLMFGRPTRITARVKLGSGKVLNIEREVDMSGPIHSKGVLILTGFLGERYALQKPLSLSASLVFEQSYSGIDGDSASSAELYVLLSAIAEIPIKQSLAVTGSINQHGRIQPIGGVNEKIEGYFDVCKANGLTGEQGVLIPDSNVKNLMLKEEVRKAVEEGKFHIYPVSTADEGMALLTGREMGERDAEGNFPPDTVNNLVEQKLQVMAERRKLFAGSRNGTESKNEQ